MERFARGDLESFEIDLVAAIKLDVLAREIFAHNADESDRGKKTGGDRRVAGGTAEQAGVFGVGVLMESRAVEPTIENTHALQAMCEKEGTTPMNGKSKRKKSNKSNSKERKKRNETKSGN